MASKQYHLVIPNPHEVLLIQGKAVSKFVHFLTVSKSKVVVREWSIKELFWTISQNCFCTMLWSLPTNPQAIFKAGLFCRSHGEREWKSLSAKILPLKNFVLIILEMGDFSGCLLSFSKRTKEMKKTPFKKIRSLRTFTTEETVFTRKLFGINSKKTVHGNIFRKGTFPKMNNNR